MTFDVGQKVVYPNHGVCVVEEISTAGFDGHQQMLYHLRLLSNNSKVMVPKENLELVGLRRLCSEEEIQALFEILEDGNIDTYKDWKGRYKQNLDKMKTGRLTEVAEVLKNLCLVSQKKSLSFREKKMYERARYFIVSEVAHVRDLDEEAADDVVEGSLQSSLEKLRIKDEKNEAEDAAAASKKAAEADGKSVSLTEAGKDDGDDETLDLAADGDDNDDNDSNKNDSNNNEKEAVEVGAAVGMEAVG